MSAPLRGDAIVPVDSARLARELMDEFAAQTGLIGRSSTSSTTAPPRRYLWTDAYAVGNFLTLHETTGEERWRELALRLVDEVHHTLGRHRGDDPRRGWISGLAELEGELHPTRGGLRIGKPLPERGPDEPYDARQEWDRDGQYFHYLTKWMHALLLVARTTGDVTFLRWARELAAAAHAGFTRHRRTGGTPRMMWKASVDLSRPLVPSMGHHDPLDALATYLELQHARVGDGADAEAAALGLAVGPDLAREIGEAAVMCEGASWATEDPLGIGGLLDAAARLARCLEREPARRPLLRQLLLEADASLRAFARGPHLLAPAQRRLAFRELGLAIGLHEVEELAGLPRAEGELGRAAAALAAHLPLATRIDAFWSRAEHRRHDAWTEHLDINAVMLATSLLVALPAAR